MLSQAVWLGLSLETRDKFAKTFLIPKSSGVSVAGGQVQCDGHTIFDLQALTVRKMQDYLKTDVEDFYQLFNEVVFRLENEDEKRIPAPDVFKKIEAGDLTPEVSTGKACCGSKGFRHKKTCLTKTK